MDKYIKWIVSLRGKITVGVVLSGLTFFFVWNLAFLEVDFEFEKFFPKDDPDTKLYRTHVEQFGYDNDYLQIILIREEGVFDSTFLNQAKAFENSIQEIEEVEQVFSPLSLRHVIKSPTSFLIFPLIHIENPSKYKKDSIRIFSNAFYASTFSKERNALSIYMNHLHLDDFQRSERLLETIKCKASEYGFEDVKLVGKLNASLAFIDYIEKDFRNFLVASLLIGFLLLLLIFRDFKSAFMPFLIGFLCIVWVFGLMGALGIKVNLLSALLPPILLFSSMSDAIHLINASTHHKQGKLDKRISASVRTVWWPTLLTSLTTALGFISLLWINTALVHELGLFACIGIIFAFILTFSLGLLFLQYVRPVSASPLLKLQSWLPKIILTKKKPIFFITALFVLILLPGLFKLKVESSLLEGFPKDAPIRKEFSYADSHFGGSKPYEVRVEVADSTLSIWDKSVMDQLLKIENYLVDEYPVASVQSPITVVKYLSMVNNGGLNKNFNYPKNEGAYKKNIRLKKRIDARRMNTLITEDGKVARMMGVVQEKGSFDSHRRNQKMRHHLRTEVDSTLVDYKITGTTYLIEKSHERLSGDLIRGLFVAIVFVALILGIYFRSWKLLFVGLIPNIIPLLVVGGVIGWMGIPLQMTTSIIFVIAFGITVDDTIHMMSHYFRVQRGKSKEKLEKTFLYAGNAMVTTTITMLMGFSLYLFSNFGATYYLGLFVCLSLIVALVLDLTFLPALMTFFHLKPKLS